MSETHTYRAEHLVNVLCRRAALEGYKPAYTFLFKGEESGKTLTFAELDARARAIASRLRMDARAQDRALLVYSSGLEFIEAFWGCLYARLVAVPASLPVNSGNGASRLQGIAADCSPQVILCAHQHRDELEGKLSSILGKTPIIATDDVPSSAAGDWRSAETDGQDIALLQYSSGSTASPKGIVLTHENITANQVMIMEACGHTQASTFVGWLPFFHDMGLFGNIIQPLFVGAHSILMSPMAFLQKPIRWLRAITRYRAHTSGGPNFAYEFCLRRVRERDKEALDLSSWKIAFNGAEKPRPETMKRFATAFSGCGFSQASFYPCYGLAEAVLFVTGGNTSDEPRVTEAGKVAGANDSDSGFRSRREYNVKLASSGHTWLQQRLEIVNPDTRTMCSDRQMGEVWIKGPNVAKGYWNNPLLTEATFHAFLESSREGPFLRTGDLGFLSNGELYVAGRIKDLIILRGQNYYSDDIEAAVERCHEDVEPGQCVAFSVENDTIGERLVVILEVPKAFTGEAGLHALSGKAASMVAEQCGVVISQLLMVRRGTIPKTSSGKIQRFRCRELYLNGSLSPLWQVSYDEADIIVSDEEHASTLRQQLRGTSADRRKQIICAALQERFCKVTSGLALEDIATQSSLIQNGLDSIRAVDLKQWIERVLGVSISVAELFESTSIQALVDLIETRLSTDQLSGGAGPLAESEEGETGQLSFGQQALYFEYEKAPHSAAYNISAAIQLTGEIDKERLQQACSALVKLHPQLGMTFVKDADGIRQQSSPRDNLRLRFVDASSWTTDECRNELSESANVPFNLEESAARLTAFTCNERRCVLLIVIHHIIVDLLSLEILLRDMAAIYAQGGQSNDAVVRNRHQSSYTKFVKWQRQFLKSDRGQQSLEFWRKQLEGRSKSFRLAFSKRAPTVQENVGRAIRLDFSGEIGRAHV